MTETKLYIPTKIKVGYQDRDDTYSKKLGFVIYADDKGKWRQETSWDSWLEGGDWKKKNGVNEYDNKPIEGFVLNKDVGGTQRSYDWHGRREKVRVFDPRGFEFEITVETLLFILQESTSTKGKGLEGQFVYAWSGKNIGIIPVDCEAYRKSLEHTKAQGASIGAKDLVAGCTYQTKNGEALIYLGKFNFGEDTWRGAVEITKGHVFAKPNRPTKEEKNEYGYDRYSCYSSLSSFAYRISDSPVDNYAELMDEFSKTHHCISAKSLRTDKVVPYTDGYQYSRNEYNFMAFRKSDKGEYEVFTIAQESRENPLYSWGGYLYLTSNTVQKPRYILAGYRVRPAGKLSVSADEFKYSKKLGEWEPKIYSQQELDDAGIRNLTIKGKAIHFKG